MIADPQDTIVALSSAPGPAARAIIRLSGSQALSIVAPFFTGQEAVHPKRRHCYAGQLCLRSLSSPLPADLHFWPAPRTYTGQEIVELHTISSPPLVDLLIAQLLNAGARAAQPGEFTLRAFLAGKLDLTRAEAVLGVIEAGNRDQLKQALEQLAGGVTQPMRRLRDDLLNLLADLEASLDFSDEDIRFVKNEELLQRLTTALAQLRLLEKQLDQRTVADRPFRVVLIGRPNVGKSSLFNALLHCQARERNPASSRNRVSGAIVSPEPGTTRDYLIRRLNFDGVPTELIDTAGLYPPAGVIEEQAQSLGKDVAANADLLLLCLEVGKPVSDEERNMIGQEGPPALEVIITKCDLTPPRPHQLATSAVTGAGIETLQALIVDHARTHAQPPLAPSISRCRHHVEACLEHLRRVHEAVLFEEPLELLTPELRGAVDELGEMIGAVYTDDLLDRIFSRFCIGK